MTFFLDTEFIERGPKHPVTLISIGIVAEDGREFYGISTDFDPHDCNEWVKANVLPNLGEGKMFSLDRLAKHVALFCGDYPEFWGYYCDYDWVVFAQMFGTMMDLPEGWPMYCRDLKQWCDDLGNPELPKQSSTEHNALADAKWNRSVYDFLKGKA